MHQDNYAVNYTVIPPFAESQQHQLTETLNSATEAWVSLRFPAYPIQINLSTKGQPFSRLELSCCTTRCPSNIRVHLSDDFECFDLVTCLKYDSNNSKLSYVIRSFIMPARVNPQYIRLTIDGCLPNKSNLCKQVAVYMFKLFEPTYPSTLFLYNLQAYHKHAEPMLKPLQNLEISLKQATKERNFQACVQIKNLIDRILSFSAEYNTVFSKGRSSPRLNELRILVQTLSQKHQVFFRSNIHKQANKGEPIRPSREIRHRPQVFKPTHFVPQPSEIPELIRNVFCKFPGRVTNEHLDLLTSTSHQDKQKYIIDIWSKITSKGLSLTDSDEQLMLESLSYLLDVPDQQVQTTLLQILAMMFKLQGVGFKLKTEYSNLLQQLVRRLNPPTHPLHNNYKQSILTLSDFMEDRDFIDVLINTQPNLKTLAAKLQIINSLLTQRQLEDYSNILNLSKQTLKSHEASKKDKELTYVCLSKIAQRISKQEVLGTIGEDLPTHILLNLQKILLKNDRPKTSKTTKVQKHIQNHSTDQNCAYCQRSDPSFSNPDLYDLHCFKQCPWLTECPNCQGIIQIGDLYNHFLKQCPSPRHEACKDCGIPYLKGHFKQHKQTCRNDHVIECPLCNQLMLNHSELKKHILVTKCLNNKRK